jgi:CheY-like chemotaxis protein
MDTPGLSVLLVDDNRDGADALAMLVEAFGHPTRVAYSGDKARELITSGYHPDALILDLWLGKESGCDLARDLCAQLPRRPLLVAVTGHPGLAERSRAAGFDHHFLKPTDLAALRRVLAEHAGRLQSAAGLQTCRP